MSFNLSVLDFAKDPFHYSRFLRSMDERLDFSSQQKKKWQQEELNIGKETIDRFDFKYVYELDNNLEDDDEEFDDYEDDDEFDDLDDEDYDEDLEDDDDDDYDFDELDDYDDEDLEDDEEDVKWEFYDDDEDEEEDGDEDSYDDDENEDW